MKFEVEGHLGIAPGEPRLVFKHPAGRYEAHLENHAMAPGLEVPLLHAYFLFRADTLEDADKVGAKLFAGFLDFLALATGARFRGRRRICLYDWTPGITERHGYLYRWIPDPNLPQLALSGTLVQTLESLLSSDDEFELMRALHWFRKGVAADASDEQFQLFWFTIETLTRYYHPRQQVADLCARCRDPLFCRKCEKVSRHRPYPAQAIQLLFTKHLKNDSERAFKLATDMRHALLHGDGVEKVERQSGMELSKLADLVGQVAWAGLLSAIVNRVAKGLAVGMHLDLTKPSTFLHYGVGFKAHVSFSTSIDHELQFTDLPDLDVTATVGDESMGMNAP